MDIINILPDSVANQIAAGEVVDRPASAVKELLENAIDAGATEIQLIVKDAGRTLIQVVDNGCGMSDSDARLCFERHATSKISRADDLFSIRTMGFRGEALPSIAAVSQVEMRTRQHDNQLGTLVVIEGSAVKEQSPCSCSPGTSISVKNLFYNIPARRNFLKRDSIELSHIEEVFRRVALANWNVAFSFHHNGRLLYDLRAGNLAQRIAGIFGNGYNQRLYSIEENTEPVKIFGYVGKAEYVKRTRGEQYIFVNQRFIKHPGLSAAIERAYAELVPEHTYPAYFVMLTVDPSRLDVNIHPTKTEVRFIDESVIFAILRAATKKALGQFSLANELEFNPSTEIDFSPAPKGHVPAAPEVSYNPTYNPFRAEQSHGEKARPDKFASFFDDAQGGNSGSTPAEHDEPGIPREFGERMDDVSTSTENRSADECNAVSVLSFQNRYILATLKSGVVVIDRQRALERILYERFASRNHSANPQQLLFPVNVHLGSADSELLTELMPDMKDAGFVLSPLGQNTFVVSAAPPDVDDISIQHIIEQIISDYKNSMLQKINDRAGSIVLTMARQLASKDSSPLRPEEMQQLMADLFSCHTPDLSPSGKRTMFVLSEQELKEKFNN